METSSDKTGPQKDNGTGETLKVRMLYVCSWCNKELGSKVTVLDSRQSKMLQVSRVGDDGLPEMISHGVCDDCNDQMMNELSAKK